MDILLDRTEVVVADSASPVSFQTEGGDGWAAWDRYIAIDGKRAFHIGNVCGTCSFFFERMEGAKRSINAEDVIERLNAGVSLLDLSLVEKIKTIMPTGKYQVFLLSIVPKLVYPKGPEDYFEKERVELWGIDPFWGLPHHPKTEYYRLSTQLLKDGRAFYEFLIPTFPQNWLNEERVASYVSRLQAGEAPTAVALSVLDVKQPANRNAEPPITSHWCLAHYLLDGHHKVFAASKVGLPLILLVFLAVEHGISSPEQIEQVIRVIGRSNNRVEKDA
jgi:hypothetical protein